VKITGSDGFEYAGSSDLSAPIVHVVDVMASTSNQARVPLVVGSDEVEDECIRSICSLTVGNMIAGLVGAIALGLILVGEVNNAVTFSWLVALVFTRSFVRMRSLDYVKAPDHRRNSSRRWILVGEIVEGTIWGLSPFLLQLRHQRYEVFVLCTLLAVSIVSSLALSPYLRAAIAFTLPIHVGLALWMAMQGGRWGWSGAGGVVLIYIMTTAYVRAAHLLLKNAIVGRLENAHLAEQLEVARARAEAANAELQSRNDQLSEIARRDPLTGLYNRRHFTEWLDRVRLKDVSQRPWFLVILDADFFKRINDEHGHQAGDRVLMSIASVASAQLRWTDCLARIGGEEFGLLLQDISFEDAISVVERVRSAVAALDLGFGAITLSAGLVAGEQDMDAAVALGRADQAMYEAKRMGRNRLVCVPALSAEVPTESTTVSTSTTAPTTEEASQHPTTADADTVPTRR
jgi:diguanylate cyclase (GGDEF)-like protein